MSQFGYHIRKLVSYLNETQVLKGNLDTKHDFSDPECTLVFSVYDVVNAINIILKGRQGTLKSGV